MDQTRSVGGYELGQLIGSGSFSVVWKSKHKKTGQEVAIKEIKKKILNPKVRENLLTEISVLDSINHPNIIRLYEAIETEERIYIVLEYCDGGDLAGYINRHRRVSEDVARHFIRQLAAGLQVLHEKHLIHRDLKPQNLFLSSNKEYPQLKIGDFGFVRSLPSEDVADTLCGSPLYMAPEIIQRLKYDAKADLWSVGAILFQLITGQTPFNGDCQYQLFQNILSFTELQFPEGALEQLDPDCVDLCRSLLRRNPVERLTFKEFFNHKFLGESRTTLYLEHSFRFPYNKSGAEHVNSSSFGRISISLEHPYFSTSENANISRSPVLEMTLQGGSHDKTRDNEREHGSISKPIHDRIIKSSVARECLINQPEGGDSVESIEKDYVLVNCPSASVDNFSFCFDKSLEVSSNAEVSLCLTKKNNNDVTPTSKTEKFTYACVAAPEKPQIDGLDQLSTSSALPKLEKVETSSALDQSTRLQLLHQYVLEVAELSQEKYNAGLLLGSFSVELVVLAIWKKIHELWTSRLALVEGSAVSEKLDNPEKLRSDCKSPLCDSSWVEQGFIMAFERAEKLSHHIQEMDAAVEIPDGMELIFKKALTLGTSGAVHEYMGNKSRAVALYSKAVLWLSFILNESTALSLNPPFSLTPNTRDRIQSYINNIQSRQSYLSAAAI